MVCGVLPKWFVAFFQNGLWRSSEMVCGVLPKWFVAFFQNGLWRSSKIVCGVLPKLNTQGPLLHL